MREMKNSRRRIEKGIFSAALLSLALFIGSCTKYEIKEDSLPAGDLTAPTVLSATPGNNSTDISTNSIASVTFSETLNTGTITSSSFTIKQGTTVIPGTVTINGTVVTFTPSSVFSANTQYTGTITTAAKDVAGNAMASDFTWIFTTAAVADVTAPTILSVLPSVNATSAAINTMPSVTFSEAMNAGTITNASFTIKQGTSVVAGTITYSNNIATFTPSTSLQASKVYTGTITTAAKDVSGNALASNYTWSFTTSALADETAPSVLSVSPAQNATSVAVNNKPMVTFSEAMNQSTVTSSTFLLKQGATTVPGTVTGSGSTATFSPTTALVNNTVYTATITSAAKDVSGNTLAANYTWSFTTASITDATAPTVLSVSPAQNATSVAVNYKPMVTFSEAMNQSTVTSSTFTLKQGSTTIAGTVTGSGSAATFTPSAALSNNTVYTVTITAGVKDAAGNSMASNYSWSFTTVTATTSGKSFSADVAPILNLCNTCHTHKWTPSSNSSTFYTNMVNAGYVVPASPTTSKIYSKINNGHPSSGVTTTQKNTILTWMTEGSKNN